MSGNGKKKKKKLNIVHCRICKGEIDRNIDPEGHDWLMASKNFFYHRSCYENWKKGVPKNDDAYVSFIYDFISRDLKVKYDYHMCEAQRQKFLKEHKMTNKGIFFTLKYFYEVKKGSWEKSHGGIGIVPYIYNEACSYWVQKEKESKGIVAQIENQMKQAQERKKKIVRQKKTTKDKSKINLSAISEMESDE